MSISIEMILLLLAAVGVTISIGTLSTMSDEEKSMLADSLMGQMTNSVANDRQEEFIRDMLELNEEYESQKKESISTNIDGTKTQTKALILGIPDRTFQNMRQYAVGINKGVYSLQIETLTNVKSYQDIVNYFLSNDLVDSSVIGTLTTRVQEFYSVHTSNNMNVVTCVMVVFNSGKSYKEYRNMYYLFSSDFELTVDIEKMRDTNRAQYIYFLPNTNSGKFILFGNRNYLGSTQYFKPPYTQSTKITVVNDTAFFLQELVELNVGESAGVYVSSNYKDNFYYDLTKTPINANSIANTNKATSTTKDENYDISGIGSVAKNPSRVMTIDDLEDALQKVGAADLVGTNTAEKVIPYDTTTDKTIADDIPITDAIENLDNSLPTITPLPDLPSYVDGGSSTDSLFKMYHVTTSTELPQLASILWDENLITQLQKWISNPMDYIVSLQAFPISPSHADYEIVKLGSFSTNLSMYRVASQFMTFNCGSVLVNKKFFNFLDYVTTIDIYLPFIGLLPLNVNEVIGGKITVDYQIDFLSGSCIANVRLIKDNKNVIISTNSGNMSAVLPLSGKDFSNIYGALIGTVGGTIGSAVGFASGNVALGATSALGALNNISGLRQNVRNNGTINGNSGLLNYKKPFVIVNRPIPKIPNNYGKAVGYLDNTERKLNEVRGFSKIVNVDLTNVTLTELEKERIREKLEQGCIF